MNEEIVQNRIQINGIKDVADSLRTEIAKVIVGQQKVIDLMLISVFANGHVLLEGVPGIAKTLLAKLMAKCINVDFSRIQFTPDLMPSDVIGTSVFHLNKSLFEFNKGPIFSNLILIDEINRSPAKTQAALFEVMEERQITVDGNTYQMNKPFLVFATQNPIEHEGTYRLPEAQMDRFLFKIKMNYPTLEDEVIMLERCNLLNGENHLLNVKPIVSAETIIQSQKLIHNVKIEDNVLKYIALIINKTRNHAAIYLGASPRASINLLTASKAFAALQGRDFVTPDDIKYMVDPVLNHRILLTPEKEMEGVSVDAVIQQIIDSIDVPR